MISQSLILSVFNLTVFHYGMINFNEMACYFEGSGEWACWKSLAVQYLSLIL